MIALSCFRFDAEMCSQGLPQKESPESNMMTPGGSATATDTLERGNVHQSQLPYSIAQTGGTGLGRWAPFKVDDGHDASATIAAFLQIAPALRRSVTATRHLTTPFKPSTILDFFIVPYASPLNVGELQT